MVIDLALDETGNVYIDETGDLATVEGRAAFEQRIQVQAIARFDELFGKLDRDNVKDLVEVEIRNIANSMDQLEEVAAIELEFDDETPETLNVEVIYDTGEVLSFST